MRIVICSLEYLLLQVKEDILGKGTIYSEIDQQVTCRADRNAAKAGIRQCRVSGYPFALIEMHLGNCNSTYLLRQLTSSVCIERAVEAMAVAQVRVAINCDKRATVGLMACL